MLPHRPLAGGDTDTSLYVWCTRQRTRKNYHSQCCVLDTSCRAFFWYLQPPENQCLLVGWVGSLAFILPAAAVAVCYEIQPSQVPPKQLTLPPNQARKQVLLLVELPRALMEALDFLQTPMCATQAPVWTEPPALMASTLSNAFAFPATEGTCVRSVRPAWLQLILLTAAPPCSHTTPQKSWPPVLPSVPPSSQWANL